MTKLALGLWEPWDPAGECFFPAATLSNPLALSARLVRSLGNNDLLVNTTDDKSVVDLPSLRAGPKVRGAWLSGLALAERILNHFFTPSS